MISKTLGNSVVSFKKISFGIFIILANANVVIAQINNNAKKVLLANLEMSKATTIKYFTKEANILFPTLLKGNEEQSIVYIEKFATNRRDYLIRTYKKSKKFFPRVTSILHKHKLPQEYQVLMPLESAFNANAVSGAGAVGYWQIMDEVAKEYGLKYEPQISLAEKKKLAEEKKAVVKQEINNIPKKVVVKDDRKNFIKSTNAAARYLRDRSKNLNNDVLLIVASYNCGVGNVWEAKRKSGLSNPSFWDIKKFLPAETQAYVMNFITLNVVFNNYKNFEANTLIFKSEKVKVVTNEEIEDEIKENTAMDY